MCVNTMPKHINSDLKEEIVAARDFWKDYTSPSFCCEKDYSQIETFSTVQSLPRKVTSQQIHCKVRLCDAPDSLQKSQKLHFRLQASVSKTSEVQNSPVRKRLNKYELHNDVRLIKSCRNTYLMLLLLKDTESCGARGVSHTASAFWFL